MEMNEKREKFREFVSRDGPFAYERDILKNHWDMVFDIIRGKNVIPYEWEIQPTSRCNLSCKHCIGKNHKPDAINEISSDEMRMIIDRIATHGNVERVKFSGYYGDPLMNPEGTMMGIISAYEKGMKVGLFTNGTMLKGDIIFAIMKAEYVNISLDAGSRDSYLQIKGSDKFDDVVRNIRFLNYMRKLFKSEVQITIGYILSRENYREITQIIEKIRDSVDIIRFKVNILNNMLNDDELDEAFRQIDDAKRKYDSEKFYIVKIHNRIETERSRKPEFDNCYHLAFMGCIGCDGKSYPCDHKTYYGGNKECIVPKRDCEICPPMGFRINKLMEFLVRECRRDPEFMKWVEKYVKENLICQK